MTWDLTQPLVLTCLRKITFLQTDLRHTTDYYFLNTFLQQNDLNLTFSMQQIGDNADSVNIQ